MFLDTTETIPQTEPVRDIKTPEIVNTKYGGMLIEQVDKNLWKAILGNVFGTGATRAEAKRSVTVQIEKEVLSKTARKRGN